MYFHGLGGKQFLDLRNDFIITFDKQLIKIKQREDAGC